MGYISASIDEFLSNEYERFFMPGHKGKTGYPRDLTEVDILDDLHSPIGAIKKANESIAHIYGMDYCTMSTGGSTVCIMAMLLSAKGKVLIGRDAHKAAINSLCIFNLEYEFVADVSEIGYINAIEATDAKVIYITYPAYDSHIINVDKIIDAARAKAMTVICDCAHGAHFPFSSRLPDLPRADMLCVSVHKTMGALTGGAAVFAREDMATRLKDNFSRIHSTSPSFLIMESIENAVDYMMENVDIIEEWIDECIRVKNLMAKKTTVHKTVDPTRIVISSEGYTGYELFDIYKSSGIMAEMADLQKVIFITSPYDVEGIAQIAKVDIPLRQGNFEQLSIAYGTPTEPMSYVRGKEGQWLDYKDCNGLISCLPLGAYPPGIAAVMPGEAVNKQVIKYFEEILCRGGRVFNMENGKIQVVKP